MTKKRKEPLSDWEKALLGEQATLITICQTWHIFCKVTEAELEQHGEFLDENLVYCLQKILRKVKSMTYVGAKLDLGDGNIVEVPSLAEQLADVNDEILALNPGLPCKRGVKDENGGSHEKRQEDDKA